MGPPGRGDKDLGLRRYRAVCGGRGRLHVVAIVPAVTAVMSRRRRRTFGNGSVSVGRFEFVGQDEFSEFGASGVTLGGDVHVRGVGAQQPGRQQGEGDAAPAAMNLGDRKTWIQAPNSPRRTLSNGPVLTRYGLMASPTSVSMCTYMLSSCGR